MSESGPYLRREKNYDVVLWDTGLSRPKDKPAHEQCRLQSDGEEWAMKARDFCFWLQGYFEVGGAQSLTSEQTDVVKRHLSLVFKHEIDPAMGDAQHQEKLDKIHIGVPPGRIPGDPIPRC